MAAEAGHISSGPGVADASNELALAAALVDALNRGDEDAMVALFHPEATLRADRFAWSSYEIRLWAKVQIAASIVVLPEGPFSAVPNRVVWTSRVRRADWRARGVDAVRVANQILTEGEYIIDFVADPLDGASVVPLGELWRPGTTPDRPPPPDHSSDLERTAADSHPDRPAAAGLAGAVLALAVVGCVRLRRQVSARRRPTGVLLARLAEWQRRRDVTGGSARQAGAAPQAGGWAPGPERRPAVERRFGPRPLVLILLAGTLLASIGAAASVTASEHRPTLEQGPETADALRTAESFLLARDTRDLPGAAAYCADFLAIKDADGQWWIGDGLAVRAWLRQLVQTYFIDTLVHPHAAGERVSWTERLAPRSLGFKDGLASSVQVEVVATVRNGKITSYAAAYPALVPEHAALTGDPTSDRSARRPGAISPAMLFVSCAGGLVGVAILLLRVLPAMWHAGCEHRRQLPRPT